MAQNSLINLGELSKPATVLIEKISDAIGGAFKPSQIVRVARAEVEAERLKAQGQIQISDLQRRAFHRFLEEEAKKQNNIENITKKALPELNDDSRPDQLEDDWITNFFDRCRLISDQEMQRLWSRVLAGEANAPGTYSKRTVNLVSDLDKSDAELFTRLCGFTWVIANMVPLIYEVQNAIYNRHGINFITLSHLESIGLIRFDPLGGFQQIKLPKNFDVSYYGTQVSLEMPNESDNTLDLGNVLLTKVGEQLAPICGSQPVDGFLDFIRDKWRDLKYIKAETADRSAPANQLPTSTPAPEGGPLKNK
jgi:hypothetical protein